MESNRDEKKIAAAFVSSALAFAPPTCLSHGMRTHASSPVVMSEQLGRREFSTLAAATALFSPLAAFADGAASKATRERARQVYGSRVFRLQTASPAAILEDSSMFTLFTTGAYAGLPSSKETVTELKSLSKAAIAAAKAGDGAAATAATKKFVAVGSIKELDVIDSAIYNPKMRRNPGAPPTSEIEAQMGTEKYALYGTQADNPSKKK